MYSAQCDGNYARAGGEVEEFVVEAVGNSRADARALDLVPDLARRAAQSVVAVETATEAGVGIVGVLLCVAVIGLDAAATLA